MKVREIPLAYVGSKYPESRQKNPLQTPSITQEQRPPLEKEPSKKTGWSTPAKVCAVAAIGLATAAAIYAATRQQEAPTYTGMPAYAGGTIPINPIYKEDPCEATKPSTALLSDLKTMLGSANDDVRKKVYEYCVSSFTTFHTQLPEYCRSYPTKLYNPGPWWSVLLLQDSEVLRTLLEKRSSTRESPDSIDTLIALTLSDSWKDETYDRINRFDSASDFGYDSFAFCNAQIGKESFYEAARSVAKVKIGSSDFYDRKLALMLFRSLFKEGQGYEAADEAINAHGKSADPLVRKSVLALSEMRPGIFSRIFG